MFDIASSEFLLVILVALVVIGPKDLPKVMRVVGHWVGKARGVANQFRGHFDEMIRQSELEEMEKKWQAENERIMREYPPPAASDTVAPDSDMVEPEQNAVFANDPGPAFKSDNETHPPLPFRGGGVEQSSVPRTDDRKPDTGGASPSDAAPAEQPHPNPAPGGTAPSSSRSVRGTDRPGAPKGEGLI